MIKNLTASIFLFLVFFACTYDTIERAEGSGIIIKTGTVCGWCTVNDTLTITGENVRYVNYTNCSTTQPTITKTAQISSADLNALLAKLNIDELKKLDLNSCNVCVDGCDDWISFDNGTDSHYIRFGSSDPKLQPIKEFVDGLKALKVQYASGN